MLGFAPAGCVLATAEAALVAAVEELGAAFVPAGDLAGLPGDFPPECGRPAARSRTTAGQLFRAALGQRGRACRAGGRDRIPAGGGIRMIVVNDLMRADRLAGILGVVFDCDGVLVDSLEANKFYYNWFRERFNLPPMNAEEERYTHIQNVYNSLKRIVPEGRLDEGHGPARGVRLPAGAPAHPTPSRASSTCSSCCGTMGVRMAVNTSRTNTTELLLDHLGMNGFFMPVVSHGPGVPAQAPSRGRAP